MKSFTTAPSISVSFDGAALDRGAMLHLESVRVQQCLGLPSQCELVLNDPPAELMDSPPSTGTTFTVTIDGGDTPLFSGDCTGVEIDYGPHNLRQIRVRGYDVLHRLRKQWSVRAHIGTSILDLARELTGDLGVDVDAPSTNLTWPRVVQAHQSDFELLAGMAGQAGLYPYLHGTRLELLPLAGDGDPLSLQLGQSLLEAHFEANIDPACSAISVSGWDPLRSEPHSAEASEPRRGYDVLPPESGHRGRQEITDVAALNGDHLGSIAQAHLDHRAAREVVFRGVADGNSSLQPGRRVDISNVSSRFQGSYTLSMVTHTIDAEHGYISSMSTYPPPLPKSDQRTRIGIGIVIQVDDPDNAGRVRVQFPTFAGVESEWLQVLSTGAGADKGLTILPDVDDIVLVLLAHDLPGQGIVLGGLYGVSGPGDSGEHQGRITRYALRTPGGQSFRLDDVAQSLRLETSDGSQIHMTAERVNILSTTDLDIAAPGRRITIRGQAIDFERA